MEQNKLYIIYEEKVSNYADKLKLKLSEFKFETISLPIKTYISMKDNGSTNLTDGAKYIFLGIKTQKFYNIVNIHDWQYNKFGCRIGWYRNDCVILANSSVFSPSDYNAFVTYCDNMSFDYPDVTIPPESLFCGCIHTIQKTSNHELDIIQQSQYSTLIYEFMNNYFLLFIQLELNSDEKKRIKSQLDDKAKEQKKIASANLTIKQIILCNAIIHTASISSAVIAVVPISVADAVPITAVQISMIVALGQALGNKLTKSDAQIILKAAAAPLAGRALVKAGLTFIPGVGWAINGLIAGAITQILGWTIANDFATKIKS